MRSIDISLVLAAPREEVFRAFTESEALTSWFAEHAEVSLSEKRYDFWGRFTPYVPDREAGRHPISNLEPDRISYGWQLQQHDTVVSVGLTPVPEGTLLELRHQGLPERLDVHLDVFWTLSLENLRAFVERGRAGLRCDFSRSPSEPLSLGAEIHAPLGAVFSALVQPEQLARYTSPDAEVDVEAGIYDLHFGETFGPKKILDLEPDHTLAHDWRFPGEPDSVVTWTCEELGEGTRLTIVHSGFSKARGKGYALGWLSMVCQLRNMIETGERWREALVEHHAS